VIGVEEHQLTVTVQLAPEASVAQLLAWRKGLVTFTELREVLVLNGLVTVTVPDAQANISICLPRRKEDDNTGTRLQRQVERLSGLDRNDWIRGPRDLVS
jgi:hypothetical protein